MIQNKITILKLKKMLPYYNEQIPGWDIYFNERDVLIARRADGFEIGIGRSVAYDMDRIKAKLRQFT